MGSYVIYSPNSRANSQIYFVSCVDNILFSVNVYNKFNVLQNTKSQRHAMIITRHVGLRWRHARSRLLTALWINNLMYCIHLRTPPPLTFRIIIKILSNIFLVKKWSLFHLAFMICCYQLTSFVVYITGRLVPTIL